MCNCRPHWLEAGSLTTAPSQLLKSSIHASGHFVNNNSKYISGGDLEPPTAVLWVYHFLAQHFDYLRDSKKAMEYIDKALEHTPTLIEAYMVKARIYKVLKISLCTRYSCIKVTVETDFHLEDCVLADFHLEDCVLE